MEFEQIGKRLEWLDEQQRLSKTSVGDLVGRIASLETSINALSQQLKALSKDLADLTSSPARIDQFEQMLSKQRTDLTKTIDAVEKTAAHREQENQKVVEAELIELRKSIFQFSQSVNLDEIHKKLKDRAHEEQRLATSVQDTRASIEPVVALQKELAQSMKAMEDARRQDARRLADLQGEIAATRKRADDAREKSSIHADAIRNVENRMSELVETESSRQEAQVSFLAQQAVGQLERDRAWKEWQSQYESFKQQAESMAAQVINLDDSIRAAKRAQESYTDLNQRLERRIAEVGEMQRLAEDRVRQEWVAFKADEQKRWTAHSLSQEESTRDVRKALEKVEQRITTMEDAAQTVQDQLQQTTDATEKQLQELMNVAHEWLTAYERIMGHVKTKAKKGARSG